MEIKKILEQPEYGFLRENPLLGDRVVLLGLGGSHAYGTNVEGSDVDIRGVALNSRSDILGLTNFERVIDNPTDTTIYSFRRMVSLLCECNPNVIEILGLKPEHYFIVKDAGQMLLDNKKLFLSQRAIYSFGGYAKDQLRRLENKSSYVSQEAREAQIKKSLEFAYKNLSERYGVDEKAVKFFVEETDREGFDKELFVDVSLQRYPLRDFTGLLQELTAIVRNSDKLGRRNEHAIDRNRLAKHQMHLLRLYYMCFDILEREEIVTYRDKEHDLLMRCRAGEFLKEDNSVTEEFSVMLGELEKRLDYASENTSLPKKPDMKGVEELLMTVNEMSLRS